MSESPYRPVWVDPLCDRFGMSPAGTPWYRVVWSEDRLSWFFGEQRKQYGEGRNRWIIEKWFPCRESREEWALNMQDALGPYPENGEYEHAYTLEVIVNEGEQPSFMPLRENIVELVLRALEAGKLRHTEAERKAAIDKREAEIKAERKRRFDDLWHDSAPAPGAKIPEHIQMMDSFSAKTTADLPAFLPKKGFKQLPVKEA